MADVPHIVLYHAPRTRSGTVLWLLEETGLPFELRKLDLAAGEHKRPDYLAVNPMGKVPALVWDGAVITESAAICAFVADAVPAVGLAPALGDPQRGPYLRWMFWAAGCLEPAIVDRVLQRPAGPARTVGYGDFDSVMRVLAGALDKGPWLLGDRFTAADILVGAGLRWAIYAGHIERRAPFGDYVAKLAARPASQRAMARDG
ncbi:MAG: glutathione S-transferase family protein [Geminicoccaceae bacterium]